MSRVFDGTASFTAASDADPVVTTSLPAEHTPGNDSGATNDVVRTYDLYSVRAEWSVNEGTSTGLKLTMVLPSHSEWAPDETGMFTGCLDGSTIEDGLANDGKPGTAVILNCLLGDPEQGTHGAVQPIAKMGAAVDSTTFNVTTTLSSDQNTTGITAELPRALTVSEAPLADWSKQAPVVTGVMDLKEGPGYLYVYPIALRDLGQSATPAKGSGRLADNTTAASAPEIVMYDHMWNMADGSRLAFPNELEAAGIAGDPCGAYAQTGPFPAVAQGASGTWTCESAGNSTTTPPYPIEKISINNYGPLVPAPAVNADNSKNGSGYVLTGQIVIAVPKASVDADLLAAKPNPVLYDNAVSATIDDVTSPDVAPVTVTGESGQETIETNAANNNSENAVSQTGPGGGGGGGGGNFQDQWGEFTDAIKVIDYPHSNGTVATAFDDTPVTGSIRYWEGSGTVARSQDIGMQLFVGTSSSTLNETPVHGCMVWDPQQIRLKDMQPEIKGYRYENRQVTEYFSRPPSNSKYDLLAGPSTGSVRRGTGVRPRIIPWSEAILKNLKIHVEFARAKSFSAKVAEGEVNCNEDAADSNGWVDGDDAATLSAKFDPDGDGLYEVDMVRVRTEGKVPWYWTMDKTIMEENGVFGFTATSAIAVSLTGAIGTDFLGVNKDTTVVRLHSARSNGAWNPSTENAPPTENCFNWNQSNDYDDDLTPTAGWCSNSYDPAGENSSNQTATKLDAQSFTFGPSDGQQSSDSDIVTIVGARPQVDKTNLNGAFDIKDNGQEVTYRIQPSVIGAPIEALANVVLTDPIPAGYVFSKVIKEPTSPGAFCDWPAEGAVGGTPEAVITCRYSEEDPAVDTGDLPKGLPGGWGPESAAIEYSVIVSGASASSSSYKPIQNIATVQSTLAGVWDPNANGGEFKGDPYPDDRDDASTGISYLPFANAEGAIVKVVDGAERCDKHPTDNPPPAGWAARCSVIGLDTNAANLATKTPDAAGNIDYSLSYTNDGNVTLKNLTFVDVLPYNGDGVGEPGSETPTTGDARTPPSNFTGEVGFIGVEGAVANWVTAADPSTVSRDPVTAVRDTAWCDAVGGTVQNGVGTDADCPKTAFDVTAVYIVAAESLVPDATATITMKLDTERASCSSIWTNTFGARADQITLPIRSNDVSTMVKCTYDMAIQKRVGKTWKPGVDWVTYGESTVTFDIEVINQANPVEDFNLTDYVDTSVFKYVAADNPAGSTTAGTLGTQKTGPALPYTFVGADGSKNVTIKLKGTLNQGESVVLPITLRVIGLKSKLINKVEISYFDNDGDPSTGDSNPANPANANGGPLVDRDSTPDTNGTNDKTIDNAINLTPATGDEDDFDPAEVPWYDLALVKPLAPTQKPTVIFNGETALVKYNIVVKNQSLYPVTNVRVLDTPAKGFSYDSSNPGGLKTIGGVQVNYLGAGKFNIRSLKPNQSVTIPVTYKMTAATAIDGDMINTAEITGFKDIAGMNQPDVDSRPDSNPNNDRWKDPLVDGKKNPDFDADKDGDLHDSAARRIDEDDHDRVMVNTVYSLGNEVWLDTNNNGKIDAGEPPISEVSVSLYRDADGNGFPDDTDGDRFISVDDAIARDVTDSNGLYLFSNLPAGKYIVAIDASNWDEGGQLSSYITSGPTETNPNADVDNNDNGIDSNLGFVLSGTVELGPKEPLKEPGPDNDTNADILSNLTVDFGFYRPNFDLALRKRLANSSDVIIVGQQVTFNIEVFNQGTITGTDIEIVDYLPNELRLDDPDWTGSTNPGAKVTYKIPGSLAPGKSIVVPITVRVVSAIATANFAEIDSSTPVDGNGKVLKFPNGVNIPDIDSVADKNNTNDKLVDDVINSSPTGVPPDEDDHDVAYIVPINPPVTGANTTGMARGALALIVIGGALVAVTRRRRTATS